VEATVETTARAVLSALAFPEGELSLLITDDSEIADINREYRDKEGPTNVLAFAMRDGEFAELTPYILGDVVISVETARREAGEMGISFEERFDELLVHGILHLFGYDHEQSEEEYVRMEQKSEELLAVIRKARL